MSTKTIFATILIIGLILTGCVMWDFIKQWKFSDNMLYPQYENDFCEKIISSYTWEYLQKRAKEFLEETNNGKWMAAAEVRKHWQSIVDGKVPFGYTVEEE